jgi:hypothetical protein
LPIWLAAEIIHYQGLALPINVISGGLMMLRPAIFLGIGAATLMVVLALGEEAYGQSSNRRSMGNLNPNPPRRSMGNFPPGQPNYYLDSRTRSSSSQRQSSGSQRQSSGSRAIVVPNRYYPGYYYPPRPAIAVPVYPPFGYGHVYVPAPGYYYPYYYAPSYRYGWR